MKNNKERPTDQPCDQLEDQFKDQFREQLKSKLWRRLSYHIGKKLREQMYSNGEWRFRLQLKVTLQSIQGPNKSQPGGGTNYIKWAKS